MKVDEAERKYMAGHALGGSFCYNVLLFGARPGPLVWGRLAALVMRITAAMHVDAKSRLQCYVDDPVAIFGGTKRARSKHMLRTILLWLVLGLKLSWMKGQRGMKGEWVGAEFKPWQDGNRRGVTVGITATRAQQLDQQCSRLLSMDTQMQRAEIRQLAGLASWLAG